VADEVGQVVEEELHGEREARRQIALAQIRQYPDPALRMQARDVEEFDDDLARLVERMSRLMVDANGVGLAAPQVGVLRRLFVFRRGRDDEEGSEETIVVVNPRLVAAGEEREPDDEGCLSLQGIRVPVERHPAITLEARDQHGASLELELEGFDARIAQHELDHLDGVLILDRTTPEARREALAALRPRAVLRAG
jgi:peptide deformylase